MPKGKSTGLWTAGFIILMIAQTCDLLCYNMITPVVASYATLQGAGIADAGIIAGAITFVAIFARPFSGFFSDRLNRKLLILVTVAVSGIAMLGYAVSPNLGVFTVFRIIHGVAYAVFSTVIVAAAASQIPTERKAEGLGYFSLCYTFASAIGPALGVWVSDAFSFTALFAMGFVLAVISFVLVLASRTLPGGRPENAGTRSISWRDFISVKCLPALVISMFFMADWACISSFLVLSSAERGVEGIALFFTINALALFFMRPPLGRLVDKRGFKVLFVPAIFIEALSMAALSVANQLWMFLVIAVTKSFGHGSWTPALQAECVKIEEPDRSGVAISTFLMGGDIGTALGPILGGFICAQAGFGQMYLTCALFPLIAGVVFAAWQLYLRKRA